MSVKVKKRKPAGRNTEAVQSVLLRQVGNSHVLTIPQAIVAELKLKPGERFTVQTGEECRSCAGGEIRLSREE